ncbi:MAG: HAD family hydrolase [Armatimonadota bacterium]
MQCRLRKDLAIYQLALEKSGASPERAVFVDDQERHVLAASGIGLWGILMDRSGFQADTKCTRVRNLLEVRNLVGQRRPDWVDP